MRWASSGVDTSVDAARTSACATTPEEVGDCGDVFFDGSKSLLKAGCRQIGRPTRLGCVKYGRLFGIEGG